MPKKIQPGSLEHLQCVHAEAGDKETYLNDGAGLWLVVRTNGAKRWQYQFVLHGKRGKVWLGYFPTLSLADARKELEQAAAAVKAGNDPRIVRKVEAAKLQTQLINTFEHVALAWHALNGAHSGRKGATGKKQWCDNHASKIKARMEKHLFPTLGNRPAAEVGFHDLRNTIEFHVLPHGVDVSLRCCQYLRAIFDHARTLRLRSDNPAEGLHRLLPSPEREHHATLDLVRLPELVGKINAYDGLVMRLTMQFALLTAARSSEFRFARWAEFDLDAATWEIPPERVPVEGVKDSQRGEKMHDTRIVPLSRQAVDVVRALQAINGKRTFVFASSTADKPISENGVNAALRRMGYCTQAEQSQHGFRSLFKSTLEDDGTFSDRAQEIQMGHRDRNQVRAAYNHKSEKLEERTRMMQWWADFLDSGVQAVNVVPIKRANKAA